MKNIQTDPGYIGRTFLTSSMDYSYDDVSVEWYKGVVNFKAPNGAFEAGDEIHWIEANLLNNRLRFFMWASEDDVETTCVYECGIEIIVQLTP